MSKIVFNPPGKDEPGYLRRMKRTLELKERMESNQISSSDMDQLVEFLLPFVGEPEDRNQARECLWDGSQDDFNKMLSAISGEVKNENPTSETAQT